MKKRWVFFLPILILLLSAFFFSSCTTTTGTRVSLNRNILSKINKIGISVKKEKDFSIRYSREKMTNVGAVFFGLVGAAVESGIRSGTDQKLENEFRPKIDNFSPEKYMNDKLLYYLQSARIFKAVESIETEDHVLLKEKGFNAIFKVTIKEWGLRICTGANKKEQVQAGIDIQGLLIEDGTTVWERNELYLDGECHPLEELRSQEEIIENILARALENLSSKIVNEILFP